MYLIKLFQLNCSVFQIVQAMCYVSLALIIAWCLSLDEEKNDRQKVHKKHGIIPFIRFVFKWLPMVYIFPLCARILHAYFNKYLIDIFVEKYDENVCIILKIMYVVNSNYNFCKHLIKLGYIWNINIFIGCTSTFGFVIGRGSPTESSDISNNCGDWIFYLYTFMVSKIVPICHK